MDLGKLNNWLQLAAGLGVIIGLLLVAAELQQNAALTRAVLNSDEHTQLDELARSMQQEPLARALAKSYDTPLNLEIHERIMLDGYYREIVQKVIREWLFIQRGIYVDEIDVYAALIAKDVLSSEFGRAWWKDYNEGAFPPGLAARIDEFASKSPPVPAIDRLRRLDELLN
jgi:hypothetical protein